MVPADHRLLVTKGLYNILVGKEKNIESDTAGQPQPGVRDVNVMDRSLSRQH